MVWIAALHRVCLENVLFLPSFPISDMSNLELEKAAMGPRRWIELCGAIEKRKLNDPGAILRPRSTRIIDDSLATGFDYEDADFYIVPGRRFLVIYLLNRISILDLGYTSSADCKLFASVELEVEGGPFSQQIHYIQATLDGMGLLFYSPTT